MKKIIKINNESDDEQMAESLANDKSQDNDILTTNSGLTFSSPLLQRTKYRWTELAPSEQEDWRVIKLYRRVR
ncbi:MAG: hypothetical protein Tsb005_12030 [Gammaproteobacteria bacterium]